MRHNCKSKIIEAATYEFATRAYDSVTIKDIADRVQVSPPTIYIYFEDKEDLLHAAMNEPMKAFDDILQSKDSSNKNFQEIIAEMTEVSIENKYGRPSVQIYLNIDLFNQNRINLQTFYQVRYIELMPVLQWD